MALSITLSFFDLKFHPSIKFKLHGLAYFNTKKISKCIPISVLILGEH
jgi:hypothetical protein